MEKKPGKQDSDSKSSKKNTDSYKGGIARAGDPSTVPDPSEEHSDDREPFIGDTGEQFPEGKRKRTSDARGNPGNSSLEGAADDEDLDDKEEEDEEEEPPYDTTSGDERAARGI